MKRFKPIYDTIDTILRPIVKSLLLTLLDEVFLMCLLLNDLLLDWGFLLAVTGRFATTRFFAALPFSHVVYINTEDIYSRLGHT
jgi:hypothetical protein